jgi:hypothetical protein
MIFQSSFLSRFLRSDWTKKNLKRLEYKSLKSAKNIRNWCGLELTRTWVSRSSKVWFLKYCSLFVRRVTDKRYTVCKARVKIAWQRIWERQQKNQDSCQKFWQVYCKVCTASWATEDWRGGKRLSFFKKREFNNFKDYFHCVERCFLLRLLEISELFPFRLTHTFLKKNAVFWHVMSCSLVGTYRHYTETYFLHY